VTRCRAKNRACHLAVYALGLLLFAALCGCGGGPKLVPAGGAVKYKNVSIPGADVVLVPDGAGQPAIGRTDDHGQFTLSTGGLPGALVGSYKVSITAARPKRAVSAAEAVAMSSEQIAANREELVPVKYNNPISSELTATVSQDSAANQFVFDLK
jgi:hypothetical protein